jgi:hypothetical protein
MAPNKKVNTPFQPAHKLTYAVEVVNTTGDGFITCRCMFCEHIGRDAVEVGPTSSRKRKSRSTVHYFTAPFTAAKYKSHHMGQHQEAWIEYQAASDKDKKTFFEGHLKVSDTLHRYMDLASNKMTFKVKASIVDVIIKEMFFRNDSMIDFDDGDSDDEGAAAKKAAKIAQQKVNTMKLFVQSDDDSMWYTVTITHVMRFELAMDFVAIGMSFRQVAKAIEHAKIRTSTAQLTGVNDFIVSQYVRVLVGTSLQHIADLLDHDSVWAISLAGDGSTHRGQSFFDMRVRVCFGRKLFNLHLVAIPMFDSHTAENIFNMLVKFLDALYEPWRAKLIGMSSDGENTMTGRHRGLVTRMVATAENPVLRIWCAPHQIDLVVKLAAECVTDGTWINFAWSFSVFLRAQANLITRMGVKCPKKTNRWTHLGRLLAFLKSYRRQLIEFCFENRPDAAPTSEWWLITFSIAPVIDAINVTFAILQSRSLLIAQQESHINALVGTLTAMFDVEIVDQVESDDDDIDVVYESFESMRIPVDSIVAHIHDQGSFATACYDELDPAKQAVIVGEIAKYTTTVITGLMGVKAERDGANKPLESDAPPVLPAQLVKLRHGVWVRDVLTPHRVHLAKFWSNEQIDQLEADHKELLKRYHDDPVLRAAIDSHDENTSFDVAWAACPGQCDHLCAFSGGLATVFANTVAVESDFSILKWEMDENRTDMMYLSLEGVFHAKQKQLMPAL